MDGFDLSLWLFYCLVDWINMQDGSTRLCSLFLFVCVCLVYVLLLFFWLSYVVLVFFFCKVLWCISAADKRSELWVLLALRVLNFWKFTSYCSLKTLWSGMGEVVPARTLHPPSPPTVHQLLWLALWELKFTQTNQTITPQLVTDFYPPWFMTVYMYGNLLWKIFYGAIFFCNKIKVCFVMQYVVTYIFG